MKTFEVTDRNEVLIAQLLTVWRGSVVATHLFLSGEEISKIEQYVPQALAGIPHLIVAEEEGGVPLAFMGIDGTKLEMLFVAPEVRGQGLGKQLLTHGIDRYGVDELGVNEQNPGAHGFYEHMGFRVYKRSETDEQGMPYPILYMKRSVN